MSRNKLIIGLIILAVGTIAVVFSFGSWVDMMRGIVEDAHITACLGTLSNTGMQGCAETLK